MVVGPTLDNTLETLAGYTGRIRLLRCPTANLSQSRNIGLLAARGDIVAFIDDDAVPSYRWLEQYAHVFSDPRIDAAGGAVWAIHPENAALQFCLGSYSSLAEQVDVRRSLADQPAGSGGSGRPAYATRWITRFMGTNMLVRRPVLYDLGGFDEFYVYVAEEADLALRLEAAGRGVAALKEAVVYHVTSSSRYRVAFTTQGRWWMRTRSRVYLTLRHGAASGETRRAILVRVLRSAGANFPWYLGLLRARQMKRKDFVISSLQEVFAGLSAAWQALFRSPQLIPAAAVQAARKSAEPLLRFQNADSAFQPTVDPISGQQSSPCQNS